MLRSGSLDLLPSPKLIQKVVKDAQPRNWWEPLERPHVPSTRHAWDLDLREDNSQDQTQVGLPLRTRKRRRNLFPSEEKQLEDPSPIKDFE
jgi:hypothetical protein